MKPTIHNPCPSRTIPFFGVLSCIIVRRDGGSFIHSYNMRNTGQITKVRQGIPYAQIPNSMLRDNRLSMKAKGLLSFLLSLPPDWVVYKSTLPEYFSDGYSAISNAWDELEEAGYILSVQMIGDGHKFQGWNHIVYYEPQVEFGGSESEMTQKTSVFGKSTIGSPNVGKAPTTNKEDTKKDYTKKENYNIVELTEIDKEYNSLVDYINEKTGRSFRKVDSIKKKFTARRKQGYEMQTFFTAVDVSTSKDYHQKNGFQYITPEFICREDKLELYGTQVTRAKVELKSPNAKDEYKRILAIGWDKCSEEELEWVRAYQHADDSRVYKTLTTEEKLPNKVGVRKTIAQLQYERDLG